MPVGFVISAVSLPILISVDSGQQATIRFLVVGATIPSIRWLGIWVKTRTLGSTDEEPSDVESRVRSRF
jgi:hypothetical protein